MSCSVGPGRPLPAGTGHAGPLGHTWSHREHGHCPGCREVFRPHFQCSCSEAALGPVPGTQGVPQLPQSLRPLLLTLAHGTPPPPRHIPAVTTGSLFLVTSVPEALGLSTALAWAATTSLLSGDPAQGAIPSLPSSFSPASPPELHSPLPPGLTPEHRIYCPPPSQPIPSPT